MLKVNIYYALLLSVLTVFGVFYFSTHAFALNVGQIISLCLGAIAWLVLFMLSGKTASATSNPLRLPSTNNISQQNQIEQDHVKMLGQALNALIDTVKAEFNVQLIATDAELKQVKSLMDDAIDDLVDSFISLEASTRIEQKLVMLLASNEAENDNDELNPFREKQLKSKQLLNEIALKLNTLIKDAKHNESDCKALNTLEQKAKISINTIEQLLEKIGQNTQGLFVDDVRKHARELHSAISNASKTVNKLSADSKIYTQESKDISNKITKIMDENASNIASVADEMALTTTQIEQDVQTAVRSLQFQDMTTQLITQCGERQKIMQDILNTLSAANLHSNNASIADLQAKLISAQADLRQASKVRMKEFNMDGGSIELF